MMVPVISPCHSDYIGKSKNVQLELQRIGTIPDGFQWHGNVLSDAAAQTGDLFHLVKKYGLSVVPGGC